MPGRRGRAKKGGRSTGRAQLLFGGVSPRVPTPSSTSERMAAFPAAARLNSSTVRRTGSGSSPAAAASSGSEPARSGGYKGGRKRSIVLEATRQEADRPA